MTWRSARRERLLNARGIAGGQGIFRPDTLLRAARRGIGRGKNCDLTQKTIQNACRLLSRGFQGCNRARQLLGCVRAALAPSEGFPQLPARLSLILAPLGSPSGTGLDRASSHRQ